MGPRWRARTVDLGAHFDTGPGDLAHLDDAGRAAVQALPHGLVSLRGIPFQLAPVGAKRRFVRVAKPLDIRAWGRTSHIVLAMFCQMPPDLPPSTKPGEPEPDFLEHVGQPVATLRIQRANGEVTERPIRRGIEVEEAYSTLEPVVFAAVSHTRLAAADWRGPHQVQRDAVFGMPGSSSMAALPGSWAVSQSGVAATEDGAGARLWLLAVPLGDDELVEGIELRPTNGPGAPELHLAGLTLFRGRDDPLAYRPRETLRLSGPGVARQRLEVDLGVVGFRSRPLPTAPAGADKQSGDSLGSGTTPLELSDDEIIVDVAGSRDARFTVGRATVPLDDVIVAGHAAAGRVRIELLSPTTVPLRVRVIAADRNEPTPARVHIRAADGRYLPPNGHRREINPGLMEDYGSDLLLGGMPYAYVPGSFEVSVPPGEVHLEVTKGFEYRPAVVSTRVGQKPDELEVRLDRPLDMRAKGWVTADTHVHFLPPTSGILQAQAEGLNLVNILSTQWGELFTNVADGYAGPVRDERNETEVRVGSENRMHMLGHVSLLGGRDREFPLGTGGGITSPLGDTVDALIADVASRTRESGGIAIAAHFPFPYGELAADIALGQLDAVELFGLSTTADGPRTRSWYRFLNAGYRVTCVGGTDKMSAGTAVGAVRTYALLEDGEPFSFEAWARAVRAGRTFLTSGPLLDLEVDGQGPGGVIALGRDGGTVNLRASATSVNRLSTLEIVMNGKVVARVDSRGDGQRIDIEERVRVRESAWIAARCTTREVTWTAFPTAVGAHTSPVYVECGDRPLVGVEDARAIASLIEAGQDWAAQRAVIRSDRDRERFRAFFADAARTVRERIASAEGSSAT